MSNASATSWISTPDISLSFTAFTLNSDVYREIFLGPFVLPIHTSSVRWMCQLYRGNCRVRCSRGLGRIDFVCREPPENRMSVTFINPQLFERTHRLIQDRLHHLMGELRKGNRRDPAGEVGVSAIGVVVQNQIARNSGGFVRIPELLDQHFSFRQTDSIQIGFDPLPGVTQAPL